MHSRKDNRKTAIVKIHVAKKQLGLDDDTYRAMLLDATKGKKDSCRDMDIGELYQVLKRLEDCGFKAKRPAKRRGQYSPKAQGQLIDVMRAVWIEMHQAGIVRDGSELALAHWAKRASSRRNGGIGVDSLDWLERDGKLASKVLEDLKQWRKRVYSQWWREDLGLIRSLQIGGQDTAILVRRLLADRRIMWWPLFAQQLGIEDQPDYCTNREELNRAN